MAVKENKVSGNVAGKFYVDDQCVDCDLCREICPVCFKRDDENGGSIVYRQPEGEEELALCREAMDSCPLSAIGDDGE
ncbi:MAG: ferredoxin [Puniceicoccales bacterium]|jgi:ferredoxin|nr:ferredoxin [Puniceicoccales bacterium]